MNKKRLSSGVAHADAVLKGDADYQADIERCLVEINRMQQEMAGSQRRIDQFRMETRAILDSTRTILDHLVAR